MLFKDYFKFYILLENIYTANHKKNLNVFLYLSLKIRSLSQVIGSATCFIFHNTWIQVSQNVLNYIVRYCLSEKSLFYE